MKLDRVLPFAIAGTAVALACGCGSAASPVKAPEAPTVASHGTEAATTVLSYAVVPGPSPKLGKSQRDSSETAAPRDDEMTAPKEPRRSSGSRRTGGFGSWK